MKKRRASRSSSGASTKVSMRSGSMSCGGTSSRLTAVITVNTDSSGSSERASISRAIWSEGTLVSTPSSNALISMPSKKTMLGAYSRALR
ncbi:MAG: hypothetical protein ACD_75C01660G0002 [uncultured bacterium]|nr:MAG: hypothetical protein ACD_75C01660G0002 [uncultured bacterium]